MDGHRASTCRSRAWSEEATLREPGREFLHFEARFFMPSADNGLAGCTQAPANWIDTFPVESLRGAR
jgi:hypothetical protein